MNIYNNIVLKDNEECVDMLKKEIFLQDLNCKSCLNKIQKKANVSDDIKVKLDPDSKILTIETNKENEINDTITNIDKILKKHNHDILLIDKKIDKDIHKNFMIAKLECANCANIMEKRIRKINGVSNANVNFTTKKLTIEAKNEKEFTNIIKEAKQIIREVEPSALLKEENRESHEHDHDESNIWNIAQITISIILFVFASLTSLNEWVEFSIYLISYLMVGYEVILNAIKNIVKGRVFDENFLMTIATIGAFAIGEFAEGVAVMLFYQVGEFFQSQALSKSRKSIARLMDIRPDYANLLVNDEIRKVDPHEVNVDDVIVVKAGEKIPLDGIVIEGNSFLDTKALTGEANLREVEENDEVLSGFINKNGLLSIKVIKRFDESTVSKILDLVENAGNRKAKTENFITKFARVYTPFVVLSALVIAFIIPIILDQAFDTWIYRALIFLVISCPCALVISIPLGFFGGIGGASRLGILVKGGNYLEALNSVSKVVFDKTGTLTKGVFKISDINAVNDYSIDDVLKYAAYAEVYSNHPIAQSITSAYNTDINKEIIENYQELSGRGIEVTIDGVKILVGNEKLLIDKGIDYQKNRNIGTIVYVAINNIYAGCIIINDEIKSEAKEAIKTLKKMGIKNIIMLTGDREEVAKTIVEELGVDQYYSQLLPNDKVDYLEKIISSTTSKENVVFVGDGINDAPVLARASIGIAMGGLGSDAAIEAADVVIMNDELTQIPRAIKIAKRTRMIVWQNIIFALTIKIFFLVLGAFGIASIWQAVFADVGVSVIAIINSMRALKHK